MKRLIGAIALLMLAACTTPGSIPPGPSVIADQTTMDERTVIAFDTAVSTAADLATVAVKAGLVKGANLDRLAALSAKARAAVLALGAAYRAGNATGYAEAIGQANSAIAGIRSLATGEVR